MWPRALAQLIELAPHITRLVPLADRFFQSKTAGEEANRRAMDAMTEGLRGDLGQVTASHAGLYRQLNEQSEKITAAAADLEAVKESVASLQARLARMEKAQGKQTLYLLIVLVLVALLAIFIPFHFHGR